MSEFDQSLSTRIQREEEAAMLHELLLALLGYTGDLIIDEREHSKSLGVDAPISDEPTFKLAPDISFIQPSERYPKYSHSNPPNFTYSNFMPNRFLRSLQGSYREDHHIRVLLSGA